jgi:hypothetical protein
MWLVCSFVAALHILWLHATTKWTEFWFFSAVVTTLNMLFVYLLHKYRSHAGLFGHIVVGVLVGYLGCTMAWVISDAIYAQDRVIHMWFDLQSNFMNVIALSLITSTITGCWLVTGLLATATWVTERPNTISTHEST